MISITDNLGTGGETLRDEDNTIGDGNKHTNNLQPKFDITSMVDDNRSVMMMISPDEKNDDTCTIISCNRTGLPFLSSKGMRLLPIYDDGLPKGLATYKDPNSNHREPVLCRICREGMHDDADDEQPTAEQEDESAKGSRNPSRQSSLVLEETSPPTGGVGILDASALSDNDDDTVATTGPIKPPLPYQPNQLCMENPLLAPCKCTGSMAFVHYLCVEQWRCRSRHPAAQNGLACETCKSLYSLPPPATRAPAEERQQQPDDWLEAMPPHVIQALRQPHLVWQISAAIVRRRWLRPVAPIFISPVVALYCRARRFLKKRGVARRRWACSLCRRRARWKCVRCLRSYYCSRQCQNVSWHIVHKHVCYKPIRLWWSCVVYGMLCLLVTPGIVRDPLMYDLGLILIPSSFSVVGVLAGGFATIWKKSRFGLDIRGRLLEVLVVLGTFWLSAVTWGLVKGFFGHLESCHGALGRSVPLTSNVEEGIRDYLANLPYRLLQQNILPAAKNYYLWWDAFFAQSPFSSIICLEESEGCFEYLPLANDGFLVQNPKCAADAGLVTYFYELAILTWGVLDFFKWQERQRRRQAPPARHHRVRHHRPHQD